MATSTGYYVLGGLLALLGLIMMIWGVSLGFLTATGSFWVGLLVLAVGIALIAVAASRQRHVAAT